MGNGWYNRWNQRFDRDYRDPYRYIAEVQPNGVISKVGVRSFGYPQYRQFNTTTNATRWKSFCGNVDNNGNPELAQFCDEGQGSKTFRFDDNGTACTSNVRNRWNTSSYGGGGSMIQVPNNNMGNECINLAKSCVNIKEQQATYVCKDINGTTVADSYCS